MYKKILNQIANVLYINLQHIEEDGLLRGKLGVAIFFYKYSRYTENHIYADFADEILDYVLEKVRKESIANFADGLSGIAWGIDYLMKNNFLDGDKDVLRDIDQIVKEMNQLDFSKEMNNALPLFTKGLYFIQRNNKCKIGDTVLELKSFLEIDNKLPDIYKESVLYFLSKAVDLKIEIGCCVQIKQKLSVRVVDSKVTDVISFYNYCWRYFLYSVSTKSIQKSLPSRDRLESFIDEVVNNLNNQALPIYQGLAGLGFTLMSLDQYS